MRRQRNPKKKMHPGSPLDQAPWLRVARRGGRIDHCKMRSPNKQRGSGNSTHELVRRRAPTAPRDIRSRAPHQRTQSPSPRVIRVCGEGTERAQAPAISATWPSCCYRCGCRLCHAASRSCGSKPSRLPSAPSCHKRKRIQSPCVCSLVCRIRPPCTQSTRIPDLRSAPRLLERRNATCGALTGGITCRKCSS